MFFWFVFLIVEILFEFECFSTVRCLVLYEQSYLYWNNLRQSAPFRWCSPLSHELYKGVSQNGFCHLEWEVWMDLLFQAAWHFIHHLDYCYYYVRTMKVGHWHVFLKWVVKLLMVFMRNVSEIHVNRSFWLWSESIGIIIRRNAFGMLSSVIVIITIIIKIVKIKALHWLFHQKITNNFKFQTGSSNRVAKCFDQKVMLRSTRNISISYIVSVL